MSKVYSSEGCADAMVAADYAAEQENYVDNAVIQQQRDELSDLQATISRLTAERDGLISALRDAFPHFEGDAPITPEAIRGVGKEHVEMIMGWQPATDRIEFLDHHGNTHAIVFDGGDFEANIPSGWGLEDGSTLVDTTTLPDANGGPSRG